MKILADTNFLVALLDSKDSLHNKARQLSVRLEEINAEILFPDCVINEMIGVISRRLREQRRVGEIAELIEKIENDFPPSALTWTYPTVQDEWPAILTIIRESKGKLNFHDALLHRTSQSLSITHVASFDADLDAVTSWKRVTQPKDLP